MNLNWFCVSSGLLVLNRSNVKRGTMVSSPFSVATPRSWKNAEDEWSSLRCVRFLRVASTVLHSHGIDLNSTCPSLLCAALLDVSSLPEGTVPEFSTNSFGSPMPVFRVKDVECTLLASSCAGARATELPASREKSAPSSSPMTTRASRVCGYG